MREVRNIEIERVGNQKQMGKEWRVCKKDRHKNGKNF